MSDFQKTVDETALPVLIALIATLLAVLNLYFPYFFSAVAVIFGLTVAYGALRAIEC